MTDRATRLAEAAIEVVGRGGVRALTHRAVDAEAGLPAGATSNVFRSRDALVAGLVDRLLGRESAAWFAAEVVDPRPRTVAGRLDAAADALVRMLDHLTVDDRPGAVARLALVADAALDPTLGPRLVATRARVRSRTVTWLAGLGLEADERLVPVVLGAFEQCLLDRLTGDRTDDERAVLLAALRAVRRRTT